MTARRLVVPALSTAVMLVVLLGLGFWQVRRLAWKTDLLARIAAAERAPGVPLGAAPPPPFTKVQATGTFRADQTALYGAFVRDTPGGGQALGAELLTPLLREGATPLLVDRGWVDVDKPLPPAPAGVVSVEGYARPAEPAHWFSAIDDAAKHRFFSLDPAPIGAALGVAEIAPFTLVMLGPPGVPDPARVLPRPPNDHFQYALTWFGLAGTLLVIFALYVRRMFRT